MSPSALSTDWVHASRYLFAWLPRQESGLCSGPPTGGSPQTPDESSGATAGHQLVDVLCTYLQVRRYIPFVYSALGTVLPLLVATWKRSRVIPFAWLRSLCVDLRTPVRSCAYADCRQVPDEYSAVVAPSLRMGYPTTWDTFRQVVVLASSSCWLKGAANWAPTSAATRGPHLRGLSRSRKSACTDCMHAYVLAYQDIGLTLKWRSRCIAGARTSKQECLIARNLGVAEPKLIHPLGRM